jgi:hypothetical protein
MKKFLFIFLTFILINNSFGQDISILIKLHEVSEKLGLISSISLDTLLIRSGYERVNRKISEQQLSLLKATECYLNSDYENSFFYIKKADIIFRNNDLNNLKFVVLIGTCANLNEAKLTAKWFYFINRNNVMLPQNKKIIYNLIKSNFNREDFEKSLSLYYYYHKRMKLLDEIYN